MMRCVMSLYFENREDSVDVVFLWPDDAPNEVPTPSEVEGMVEAVGSLTTEKGAKVSWDPERVEFAIVRQIPPEKVVDDDPMADVYPLGKTRG